MVLKKIFIFFLNYFYGLNIGPPGAELSCYLGDGWMTCDLTSFLTVFQSYQGDVWMIMKGCVQWNSVYGWEDFTSSEDRIWSARSVGQRLTPWLNGASLHSGTLTRIKEAFLNIFFIFLWLAPKIPWRGTILDPGTFIWTYMVMDY